MARCRQQCTLTHRKQIACISHQGSETVLFQASFPENEGCDNYVGGSSIEVLYRIVSCDSTPNLQAARVRHERFICCIPASTHNLERYFRCRGELVGSVMTCGKRIRWESIAC